MLTIGVGTVTMKVLQSFRSESDETADGVRLLICVADSRWRRALLQGINAVGVDVKTDYGRCLPNSTAMGSPTYPRPTIALDRPGRQRNHVYLKYNTPYTNLQNAQYYPGN